MQFDHLFIRYLLVGALNTAFGYSVFVLFIFLGLHYSIALLFATVTGVLFNFKSFGFFVFGNSKWRLIWKFILVYGVLYAVNVFLVFLFLFFLQNVYAANALAVVVVAGLGYFLNRRFVYEIS